MAEVVIMPKQGQSVESCIMTEFKKNVGDQVAVGDILFSYETDKASFDEEAKVEGTVLAVFFKAGDEVPVLTNVMVIGKPGESFEQFAPGCAAAAEVSASETPATLGMVRGGTGSEADGGVERDGFGGRSFRGSSGGRSLRSTGGGCPGIAPCPQDRR